MAAVVMAAIAVAVAIRNVTLGTADVQVRIPIIAMEVIGQMTNTALTVVILQQEDATAVQTVETAVQTVEIQAEEILLKALQNAETVNTNVRAIILTIVRMNIGHMMMIVVN